MIKFLLFFIAIAAMPLVWQFVLDTTQRSQTRLWLRRAMPYIAVAAVITFAVAAFLVQTNALRLI